MKKEFGKWLMDVAKYVVTALLLSNLFRGMDDWPLGGIMLTILGVVFIMILGLSLINMSESRVNNKKGYDSKYINPKKKGAGK